MRERNKSSVAYLDPIKSRTGGAYFIGKSLWAKGYDRLIDLLVYNGERLGRSLHLDVYGSGPDRQEIEQRANERGCDVTFYPATDHSELGDYRVFVNPSVRVGIRGFLISSARECSIVLIR